MDMCSTAEVQDIVNKAESRLDKKIEALEAHQDKRLEESHMAIAKSVSNFGADLKRLTLLTEDNYSKREIDANNEIMKEQLDRIESMLGQNRRETNNNLLSFSKLDTKINTALMVFGFTGTVIVSLVTWIFLNELQNIRESITITKLNIEETLPERIKPILEKYEFQVTNTKDNI